MSADISDTDFDRHECDEHCEGHPECRDRIAYQRRRERVTGETEPAGSHHDPRHQDVDWIGWRQQGGGHVPKDFEWRSNPRHDREPHPHGN